MAGGYTDEAYRLVMGGPMMGIALTDDALPITKATNCILVAGRDELGPPPQERPCIRCGECARICPARLMPQDLLALGRVPDLEQLEARGILDCIECGGCDYVCPSSIPLTERLVRAKHQVWEQHAAARQADHVRRRFEAREQRLARETQERNRALDQQVGEVSSLKNLGQQTIDDLMRRVESGKSGDADKDENG